MRFIGISVAFLFAGLGSATASDISYDWSGIYAGAAIGYGWGSGEYGGEYDIEVLRSEHDVDGVYVGAFAGAQRQFSNNVVLGVELDGGYRNASDEADYDFNLTRYLFIEQYLAVDLNWTASLRARAGYAVGRWLPYATGGLAIADYRITHEVTGFKALTESSVSHDKTAVGWTVGVGSEYAFTDKAFLRAEYRYSDYGKTDVPPVKVEFDTDYRLKSHDLFVGLGYRF